MIKVISAAMAFVLLLGASFNAHSEETIVFKDDVQKAQYQELVVELRCPKCQNQNIADSNAVIARDMRVKTKELLDQGYTKDEVIGYMVDRYGQFAHYQPPMTLATSMLWLVPAAFILFGVVVLLRRTQNKDLTQNDADENYRHSSLDQSSSNKTSNNASAINKSAIDAELEQLLDDASNSDQTSDRQENR